jgi:outer membrane protein assembly factor BamB
MSFLLAVAASGAPSLSLSSASGPPTTNLTVSGTGFAADALIDVYFGTTDMALEVSGPKGGFSIGLQVPAAAQPGTYWVRAVTRTSGAAAHQSFLVRTDWAEFGFTPKGKRNNPYENVLKSSTVASMDIDWQFLAGAEIYSSPAVANGVVYVGSADGKVYALNANTRTQLSSFTTGNAVLSQPAVANGVVYVGSDDKNVYALNASTGVKLWSAFVGGNVFSTTVANGVVYVGSSDSNVYALNASTGAALWSFATRDAVISSPAVANGVVYVGSRDNFVYALNAITGAKLWSFATGGDVISSPAVANGVVYVGSLDGRLYAFDLAGTNATQDDSIIKSDRATLIPDYTLLPPEPHRGAVPAPIDYGFRGPSVGASVAVCYGTASQVGTALRSGVAMLRRTP